MESCLLRLEPKPYVYMCAPQCTSEWCHLQVYTLIMLIYREKLFILHSLFPNVFLDEEENAGRYKKGKKRAQRLTVGGLSWGLVCEPSVH